MQTLPCMLLEGALEYTVYNTYYNTAKRNNITHRNHMLQLRPGHVVETCNMFDRKIGCSAAMNSTDVPDSPALWFQLEGGKTAACGGNKLQTTWAKQKQHNYISLSNINLGISFRKKSSFVCRLYKILGLWRKCQEPPQHSVLKALSAKRAKRASTG